MVSVNEKGKPGNGLCLHQRLTRLREGKKNERKSEKDGKQELLACSPAQSIATCALSPSLPSRALSSSLGGKEKEDTRHTQQEQRFCACLARDLASWRTLATSSRGCFSRSSVWLTTSGERRQQHKRQRARCARREWPESPPRCPGGSFVDSSVPGRPRRPRTLGATRLAQSALAASGHPSKPPQPTHPRFLFLFIVIYRYFFSTPTPPLSHHHNHHKSKRNPRADTLQLRRTPHTPRSIPPWGWMGKKDETRSPFWIHIHTRTNTIHGSRNTDTLYFLEVRIL